MDIIQQIAKEMADKLMELSVFDGVSKYIADAKEICFKGIMDLVSARVEEADQILFKDTKSRKNWDVAKKGQQRCLQTECGTLRYKRRYYQNKKDKQRAHLIDYLIGVESYERVDKGLSAKICNLATEHSYTKSSKIACDDAVSRQTVKNKMRQVKEEPLKAEEKRENVKILHIQADEDHVAMQDGRKAAIVKLITLHEPVEERSGRAYLPQRFCMESYDENTDDMWIRVAYAICDRYGTREDLRVYIHGDGAAWIKSGLEWINNSRFVLDRYHLKKYIRMVSGNNSVYQRCIIKYLEKDDHRGLKKYINALTAQHLCNPEAAEKFLSYVKTNRDGIKIWYDKNEATGGSCAEGLVSHILSSRLSSRPRGWLDEGLKAVSRLRVYSVNGGVIRPEFFAKKPKISGLNITRVQKALKKASCFAPLPSNALQSSRRGRPEYRLFKAIANGGSPISLNV